MAETPVELKFSSDGAQVLATIDISKNRGVPVVAEQILLALEDIGAQDFAIDYNTIEKMIQAQSQGARTFPIAVKLDAQLETSVSSDRMEASILIRPPKGGRDVEMTDIAEALAKAGVKFGIKQDVIENVVAQRWHNEKVVAAEGRPPEDGEDGRIEFLFPTEAGKPRPSIGEDGTVNFYELNIIQNVLENEPLAEKIPPTPGKNGMNVLGEEIPAKPGKDVPLPIGKGTTISKENPNLVIAQTAGQPRLMQNRIHVNPVYEVQGDVDFSTGNIKFVGDVIVRGGVLEGFTIKADANITIMGPVAGAHLEAGGSVFLNKGMHGQDKGSIMAGEDVVAKFLEHVTVKAGGDVRAMDGIILSRVTAKKNCIAEGKKGVVIGGRVSAGEEVRAKVIGNALATPTEIEAGGNPKVREELRQIEDQKKTIRLNLDRTEKGVKSLKILQEKSGALPPDKKDLLLQLTRAQFHLMGQLKKIETREEELGEILASSFKGKIVISDTIYPGVRIIVKEAVLNIRDTIHTTVFYEQDGEIQVGVYG
ncbi:MAG: FapA family protein [bacterium]